MAAEIDFQPYLQSISSHYEQWEQFYTPTDAETQAQQQNEPQPWKTPFDFGLMVPTVSRDRLMGAEGLGLETQSSKEKIERFPVLEGIRKYVKEHRQILLVGRPGSGKSTTLARLLLEEAQEFSAINQSSNPLLEGARGGLVSGAPDRPTPPSGHPSEEGMGDGTWIPVLVELRFWSGSILDRIQAFFQRHDLLLDRTQIEDLLFHRRLLLLIDGLNELPSEAARLDVAKFRQDYPKVSMIFTTRELSLGGDFGLEKKLEMQPLTEAQMQSFVRSYVPEQAEAMLRQLKDRLREFGQTPLLLWMLCGLFRQTGQILANLGEVFRAFTQGYEKNLKADVPVESDRRWWPELLQELAFWMMRGVPFGEEAPAVDVEFRVAISKVEARQIFVAFLQNKEAQAEGAAQKYLDDLLRHHLIQPNELQIEFRHQMIQEYYAAEYLLKQWQQIGDRKLQQDYLNYLKWTESMFLVATLLSEERDSLRLVQSALKVDLILAGQIVGKVRTIFQANALEALNTLKIQDWLRIEILVSIGSKAMILELLKFLENSNPLLRISAVNALGRIDSEAVTLELMKLLEDANLTIRVTVVEALGNIGTESVIPVLIKLLEDSEPLVRWSAAEALFKISCAVSNPELIQLIEESDFYVNKVSRIVKASESSSSAYPKPALMKPIERLDPNVNRNNTRILNNIDSDDLISKLTRSLEDSDLRMRWSAAGALIYIGSEAAISVLLKFLQHSDFYVRHIVMQALKIFAKDNSKSVGQYLPCCLALMKTSTSSEIFVVFRIFQSTCKYYNHDLTQTTLLNLNVEPSPTSPSIQITYDLRGANIGNWAENQHGTQHTT